MLTGHYPDCVDDIPGYTIASLMSMLDITNEGARQWAKRWGVLRLQDHPRLVYDACAIAQAMVASGKAAPEQLLKDLGGYMSPEHRSMLEGALSSLLIKR